MSGRRGPRGLLKSFVVYHDPDDDGPTYRLKATSEKHAKDAARAASERAGWKIQKVYIVRLPS